MEDEKNKALEGQEVEEPEKDEIDYKAKYEAMKAHSREWERKAKENQGASEELQKLKEQSLSDQERAEAEAKRAREELEEYKAREERNKAITKIASDNGVSVEFVGMLSGSNEEELEAQVKRALEIIPAYPARTDDGGANPKKIKKTNAERFSESFFGA